MSVLPSLSIIVPVYNVEPYLSRCLDSILSQKFKDFELLLVDDGSKDRSGDICDEYAQNDNRVKVYHKENGGVSSARNLGLDKCTGHWIMFVDSDDYVLEGALDNISTYLDSDKNDLILFNLQKEKDDIQETHASMYKPFSEVSSHQLIHDTLIYRIVCGPYVKLIRKNVLGSLRFNMSLRIGEDLLFNLGLYSKLRKSALYVDKVVYSYVIHEGSAMKTYDSSFAIKYNVLTHEVEKFLDDSQLTSIFSEEFRYFCFRNTLEIIVKLRNYFSRKLYSDLKVNQLNESFCDNQFDAKIVKCLNKSRFWTNSYLFYTYKKDMVKRWIKSLKYKM